MLTARGGLSLTYRDSRSPGLPRQGLSFKPTASPVTTSVSSSPFSSPLQPRPFPKSGLITASNPLPNNLLAASCLLSIRRSPSGQLIPQDPGLSAPQPLRIACAPDSRTCTKALPQKRPDLSSLPDFPLFTAFNRITVPSPLTLRLAHCSACPLAVCPTRCACSAWAWPLHLAGQSLLCSTQPCYRLRFNAQKSAC
jgi:hypothetical protein